MDNTRFKNLLVSGTTRLLGDTYGEYATFTNLTVRAINGISKESFEYFSGLKENIQDQIDKLDMASEPNQNAFSVITINDSEDNTIKAKYITDTINLLAGPNVSLDIQKDNGKEYLQISTTFDNYQTDIKFVNPSLTDQLGIYGQVKEGSNWRVIGTAGTGKIPYLELGTTGSDSDNSMPIQAVQYNRTFNSNPIRILTLMDRSGSTKLAGNLYDKFGKNIYSVSDDDTACHFGSDTTITNIDGTLVRINSDLEVAGEISVEDLIVDGTSLKELKKSVSDGKQKIASAITQMGVETSKDASFSVMADNIRLIGKVDGDLDKATEYDILKGKAAIIPEGPLVIGKMENYSGIDLSVCDDNSVSITQDNSRSIISLPSKVKGYINNTTVIQAYINNLMPSNVKYGITIGNADGNIVGTFTEDGTVTESDIPEGKIAYSVGDRIVGTARRHTGLNIPLSSGESYSIEPGFYYGSNKITCEGAPIVTPGTAIAADIKEGKTAWVDGYKITGTMKCYIESILISPDKETNLYGFYDNSIVVDTSGTATASDIMDGKTAWVNGKKIIGTYDSNAGADNIIGSYDLTATADDILSNRSAFGLKYVEGKGYVNALIYGKIPVKSESECTDVVLSADGTYTVPKGYISKSYTVSVNLAATALETDIKEGKTAWVNGRLITGTIPEGSKYISAKFSADNYTLGDGLDVDIPAGIYSEGTVCTISMDNKAFGNANVDEVIIGEIYSNGHDTGFTSCYGVDLRGTINNVSILTPSAVRWGDDNNLSSIKYNNYDGGEETTITLNGDNREVDLTDVYSYNIIINTNGYVILSFKTERLVYDSKCPMATLIVHGSVNGSTRIRLNYSGFANDIGGLEVDARRFEADDPTGINDIIKLTNTTDSPITISNVYIAAYLSDSADQIPAIRNMLTVADATANDIAKGKTAWVNGVKIVGTGGSSGGSSGGSGGGSTGGDTSETKVFEFTINQAESDPAHMITYGGANANFTPAHMDYDNDRFDYGDWTVENGAWFMDVKPCMLKSNGTVDYYLDPNDYSKKADGTPSDYNNLNYDGNVMIQIPKVYIKQISHSADKVTYQFSNKKLDDGYKCWAHLDNNGNEIDYCYMSAYEASNNNNKLRSISNTVPTDGLNASTQIEYARSNNASDNIWYIMLLCDRMLIDKLLLLIGKSTDTQTIFGKGYVDSDAYNNNESTPDSPQDPYVGIFDKKGMFYGTNDEYTSLAVKVFGIEHYWGYRHDRMAGCMYDDDKGGYSIKLTYSKADGSTVDGYNLTGDGYIRTGYKISNTNESSCITYMAFYKQCMIPYKGNGSSSTYYCDGDLLFYSPHYPNTKYNNCFACAGGKRGESYYSGAFHWFLDMDAKAEAWIIGTTLSCKPFAK